tara:strand:- start:1549 stop:2220 length:672 start_codon:yes stop_codon:yes gene_type:complete
MNYITHLNAAFHEFYSDSRLHGGHISLYMALFFYWNLHHFPETFYANRIEIMKLSKIGSRSTYHRLIKDLSDWEYINYLPTQNPTQKTMVTMYQICTNSSTETGRTGTLMQRYCPKNVPLSLYSKHSKQSKLSTQRKPRNKFEVVEFFKSKNWSSMDALKFYNHYEGVGWKIGGKVKIENWMAIAENWMLKAKEIKEQPTLQIVSKNKDFLMVNEQKNYGEPL